MMAHVLRLIGVPLLLGFLFLGIYVVFHLGAWRPVEIRVEQGSALHLLYQEHRGAYHLIDPAITAVENWAKTNSVACARTFGIFPQDPRAVAEVDLRSEGGCVLDQPLRALPAEFKLRTIPSGQRIVARFTGAPSIAPWKVYPKIEEAVRQARLQISGSLIHVYSFDSSGHMVTEYLQPVTTAP